MLSPGASLVSPQAARGTTLPLSATAMPRWAVSTAFSASKAASVGTSRSSSSPLMRIRLACVACVMIRNLFGGLRRRKPLDPEGADRRIDRALEHEPRNRIGGDRRKEDAVAVVAGRVNQPLDRAGTEDRGVIAAAGAMADPHLLDRQLLDRGHHPPRGIEQREQAAGRERGVEGALLDGGADDQPAVAARHEV